MVCHIAVYYICKGMLRMHYKKNFNGDYIGYVMACTFLHEYKITRGLNLLWQR